MAFALLSGVLVTLERADVFGPNQAFVTRYVGFSSYFWLGLAGLLGMQYGSRPSHGLRTALIIIFAFAFANAANMIHKAQAVGVRTRTVAMTIRSTWPDVDSRLLGRIYFDRPQTAQRLLEKLHAWHYAPFGRPANAGSPDR